MITQSAVRVHDKKTSQRGLAPATELVVLVPALMALVGLILAGGRIWLARSTVNEAAYSGARAASIERSAPDGTAASRTAAIRELKTDGLHCRPKSIETDVAGFAKRIGERAQVRTEVSCTVTFADLLLPGMPGKMTLRGESAAALDTYRER